VVVESLVGNPIGKFQIYTPQHFGGLVIGFVYHQEIEHVRLFQRGVVGEIDTFLCIVVVVVVFLIE
jgi:hypothetical protein